MYPLLAFMDSPLLVIGGVALVIVIAIVVFLVKLYVKVDQGQALIINGVKKEPAVKFNGGVVVPVFHRKEIMDISVKTLDVDRRGDNGLICNDNIRADIRVAFFVRVNKSAEDVLKVASMVGVQRASDKRTLEDLFMAKFSEALKTVGKQMNFVDLYNERQQFKEAIINVIGKDLNGYSLEDTAIDYLEQTPLETLDPNNILDAEGRRKIIDLTSEQRVQANDIQRDAEKSIKKQDVEAREAILALERQEADAEAVQKREIEIVQAREQAEIERVQAEEGKRAEQARIEAKQELDIARENAQREVEVAEKNRERAVAVEAERVTKERDLEIINRERATELSTIEKEKSVEVEKKNIADVIRERVAVERGVAQEEENIKTLRAVEEAKRNKDVAVTSAKEKAEEEKIREITAAEAAEIAAAHNAKEKVVLAEADLTAAEKEAIAQMRRAEGKQAETAAEGLALAKVKEADAIATEKQGLAKVRIDEAEISVIEGRGKAEAIAIQEKGTAQATVEREQAMVPVQVADAEVQVIEGRGKAEAIATKEKMSAEASGIAEKAESMKLLNESTRDHEEFRLKLDKEVEIAKEKISADVEIAARNAQVMATAMGNANIDIVGGDGEFFDRFVKAVGFGKSLDATVDKSGVLQTVGKEYLVGDRSLPEDLKEVLTNSRLGTDDLKNLSSAALLAKIGKNSDPEKVKELIAKAKELGFGDNIAGWLNS